jgi:hypothetical protein
VKAAAWSEEELSLLREHYPRGGVAAVQGAGVDRSGNGIFNRARKLGLKAELAYGLLGSPGSGALPTPLGMLPLYPQRVTDQLAQLAEIRGLTLSEYEFAKSRILREG